MCALEWTRADHSTQLCTRLQPSMAPASMREGTQCRTTAAKTATKQYWPLVFERPIQLKLFILLVPGGGVEPPRGCPRRILSPLRLPVPPSRLCRHLRRSAKRPRGCLRRATEVSHSRSCGSKRCTPKGNPAMGAKCPRKKDPVFHLAKVGLTPWLLQTVLR